MHEGGRICSMSIKWHRSMTGSEGDSKTCSFSSIGLAYSQATSRLYCIYWSPSLSLFIAVWSSTIIFAQRASAVHVYCISNITTYLPFWSSVFPVSTYFTRWKFILACSGSLCYRISRPSLVIYIYKGLHGLLSWRQILKFHCSLTRDNCASLCWPSSTQLVM